MCQHLSLTMKDMVFVYRISLVNSAGKWVRVCVRGLFIATHYRLLDQTHTEIFTIKRK